MNKTKCIMSSLSNPQLSGLLPGLDYSGVVLKPSSRDFRCCHGSAMMVRADGQVRRCDLLLRVQRTQNLLDHLESAWGRGAFRFVLKNTLPNEYFFWLKAYENETIARGHCIKGNRIQTTASALWALAFAATWRFAMRVHIINFARCKPQDLLPEEPTSGDYSKLIFLVEGIDKLWMPEKAFQYETIVSWCERAQVPLWSEFLMNDLNNGTSKKPLFFKKSSFETKIAAKKNLPPLRWLAPDCLSRLGDVASGVESFF